jgi:outer membrane protein OmpA-like peptidoglycan-associated protein
MRLCRSTIYGFSAVAALGASWSASLKAQETAVASVASLQASVSDEGTSSSSDYLHAYKPTNNEVEFGGFVGMLFVSDDNSFRGSAATPPPYSEFKRPAAEVGARVGYYPLSFLGGELEGMLAPAQTDAGKSAMFLAARAQLVVQAPFWSIVPFVTGGAGYLAALNDVSGDDTDPAFHFGGGAKIAVNEQFSFRMDVRDTITNQRAIGDYPNHLEVVAGASVILGREKPAPLDVDHDGILPPDDSCPNEAGPAPSGCPIRDRDGDQILDADDHCPDEAGLAPLGCPVLDADGDGIEDAMDQCVQEPGPVPSGCPDGDGDGVSDRNDQCPQVPGIAPLGCPGDSDQDGIVDPDDKCPNEPETKNNFEDSDGCPDTLPEAVKHFTGVIAGIEFELKKADIRASSYGVLDQAAKVLLDYPTLRVEVAGHTDDTGGREYNLGLSLERADAVKSYLVSRGITADRISTRGAGPDEPIVQGKTREARRKNRRIEFQVIK